MYSTPPLFHRPVAFQTNHILKKLLRNQIAAPIARQPPPDTFVRPCCYVYTCVGARPSTKRRMDLVPQSSNHSPAVVIDFSILLLWSFVSCCLLSSASSVGCPVHKERWLTEASQGPSNTSINRRDSPLATLDPRPLPFSWDQAHSDPTRIVPKPGASSTLYSKRRMEGVRDVESNRGSSR